MATRRAIVCWPACSETALETVQEWVRRHAGRCEKHTVQVTDDSHLDALLVQAYANDIVANRYNERPFREMRDTASGQRKRAVCFSFSSRSGPTRRALRSLKHGTFLVKKDEEAERVARAFAKPMLTYDGYRGERTREQLGRLLEIGRACKAAELGDALFYGDFAMLCYGLRDARKDSIDAILPDDRRSLTATKRQRLLETAGIRTWKAAEWRRENDVLLHYHGVDLMGAEHVYFMGFKIPPARVSLDISRARTGGSESRTQLLDSLLLKSLTGTHQPLPCLFESILPDASLSYSLRLDGLWDAYSRSRDRVAAAACSDSESPDLGFDVRTPDGGAGEEIERAHEVYAAVKGMPVIPMYYGALDCGRGEVKIAVETFDMTLETWMRKPRTREAWLEVLSRTAWCVAALHRKAKMKHASLDASHVLIRGAEGKRKRAAPVRLAGQAMPYNDWDVRLSGVDKIQKGQSRTGMQKLAGQILSAGIDLQKVGIEPALQEMERASLGGAVQRLAKEIESARPRDRKKPS